MTVTSPFPPAILKYLQQLELAVKQIPGLSPEEVLSDAREFLVEDAYALERSGEPPNESEHWEHILQRFGAPDQIAAQYSAQIEPVPTRAGYAPGWRICCTTCGRSAPLAAVGGIRIGAYSKHKYTVSYCRNCHNLRFFRIVKDLNKTNLTDQLGMQQTTDQVRRRWHRPWATLVTILVMVAVMLTTSAALVSAMVLAQDNVATAPASASPTAAAEKLFQAVERSYSYREVRGVDWKQRNGEFLPRFNAAATPDQFAKMAAEYLSVAKDVHITLKFNQNVMGTYQANVNWNMNPRLLPRILKSWKQHGKTVITGEANDKVRYVLLSTFDHREPSSFEAGVAAIREAAKENRPLIIDVRTNSGGDELLARRVAALFVDQPVVYAAHRLPLLDPDKIQERVLQNDPERLRHTAGCVVLMGPANMSSCEAFLLMMRAANVKLIGEKSFGSSGNPQPHDLGNGVTVMLPSWIALDAKHQPLETVGIRPDIVVPSPPDRFQQTDPVIAKAIEQLSNESQ